MRLAEELDLPLLTIIDTAGALAAHGIVDHVVEERPDASAEAPAFCRRMAKAVEELATLRSVPGRKALVGRAERFRRLGSAL
ncbi:hypothetical protein [Arthrobacter sp. zg-Y916]|uniref:hypothetical protein n=1 Tax=Arthrobacter sp. zg-Y916 TaxID=2894190 RepID=UPI003FA4B1E9